MLCGDLVKAVKNESRLAVAYHWGVRQVRRHLKGIPKPAPMRRIWTEGEDRLLSADDSGNDQATFGKGIDQ